MDDLLPALKKLFPILLMVLLMLPSAVAGKKRREARGKDRKPEPPVGDSELARRVQKNFEELMKRRAGSTTMEPPPGVEPEPWAPVPTVAAAPPPRAPARPPPAAPRSRVPAQPRRATRTVAQTLQRDRAAARRPGKTPPPGDAYEVGHDVYQLETVYRVDMASAAGPMSPDRARRILRAPGGLNRSDLRRAVLLKEILDAPIALRSGSGPIPGV